MANVYVDAAAGVGGDGSMGNPYDTMADVASGSGNVNVGDIVYCQGEFAIGATWIPEASATYRQWPDETDWVIDGSGAGVGNDGVGIPHTAAIYDLHVKDSPDENVWISSIAVGETVTLVRVSEENAGGDGIYNIAQSGGTVTLSQCTSTSAGNNGIYNLQQTGGTVIFNQCTSTSATVVGIFNLEQSDGTCTIIQCTSTSAVSHGIFNSSQSGGTCTFAQCTSTLAGSYGIYNREQSGGVCTLTECTSTLAGSDGIYNREQSGGTCMFTECTSTSATGVGIYNYGQSDGVWEAINCVSDNTTIDGFEAWNCTGGTQTIERCHARNASSEGIRIRGVTSGNVVVKNNLIINSTDEGVEIDDSNDVLVYHNTVADSGAEGVEVVLAGSTNVVVENNICYDNTTHEFYYDANATPTITTDYNQAHHPSSNFGSWAGAAQANLAAWQAASGQAANSQEGDPLFSNEPGGNYHLDVGSPCIDQGDNTLGIVIDKDGNGRDASPDMGCYEYLRFSGNTNKIHGVGAKNMLDGPVNFFT